MNDSVNHLKSTQLHPIDYLDQGAIHSGGKECLVEDSTRLTYREVQRWTHDIAWGLLEKNVTCGDAVAVLSPNGVWGYVAILGLIRANCIWIPLNARSTPTEWLSQLKRTNTKHLFLHTEFSRHRELLDSGLGKGRITVFDDNGSHGTLQSLAPKERQEVFPYEPAAHDPAIFRITQSGGTTGEPKAIVQSHAGLAANVATVMAVFPHHCPRYLLCNPMTHASGVLGFPILAMGGVLVFMKRPDPDKLLRVIQEERISILLLAPTTIYALLETQDLASYDLSALHHLIVGTAPITQELLVRARKSLGNVLTQVYAQSEVSTLVTMMRPSDYAEIAANSAPSDRMKSCGRPLPFSRIAIMNEEGTALGPNEIGEIVVRSPMVMLGYLNDPEATYTTRANGWHRTTDLGYLDADGFLYVVDRKRDMIVTGGFNVYPSEIEALINEDPDVAACAVVGVPDPRWGEAVKAVIQPRVGMTVDIPTLQMLCKERLGSVKCPKTFEVWDELPRSPLGKILKKSIREQYA